MNSRTAYFPDAQALLSLIKSRVEDRRAIGIVLGVLEADAPRQIVAYRDQGPGALPLGPESVFEIGSITKVFTGRKLRSSRSQRPSSSLEPWTPSSPSSPMLPASSQG